MSEYLNIYDHTRRKVAILENAHNIVEDEQLNAVNKLSFDLPIKDPKTALCQPFFYARYGDNGQLYRILTPTRKRSDVGIYSYTCEHVLATLIDDVIFGATVFGNLWTPTRDVINFILGKQTVQNWVLHECDYALQFEYAWENENLLTSLFSIPNRFITPYMWKYDTTVYPWRISLKKIDVNIPPQFYVRAAKNMLVSDTEMDYAGICTRLYMLGYGEGINQLTVSEVNGGKPYIQSDQSIINAYGGKPISRILVDRRFEDPQSLLAYGKAQLAALEKPVLQNTLQAADLYNLTKADYDKAEIGRIIKLTEDNTTSYIVGIRRNHDTAGDMSLTIANTPVSVAGTIADLADRQRIESVYAQGATQIYAQSIQANATSEKGAIIRFFIPSDMRIINWVMAKITLNRFRSYSKSTKGGGSTKRTSSAGGASKNTSSAGGAHSTTSSSGGGSTQTSSSGGGSSQTSSSGGGSSTTSGTGGQSTQTSSNGGGGSTTSNTSEVQGTTGYDGGATHDTAVTYPGESSTGYPSSSSTGSADGSKGSHSHEHSHTHSFKSPQHSHSYTIPGHTHGILLSHSHTVSIPAHSHTVSTPSHTHSINIQAHTHSVNIPAHTHSTNIPSHTHSVSIPNHTHTVEIPNHTHEIEIPDHTHEIEQGIFEFGSPTSAQIYVNGTLKANMERNAELDISQYLLGSDRKIPRGNWLSVEVRPNDLAYITIDLIIKGFCQSRGDNTY